MVPSLACSLPAVVALVAALAPVGPLAAQKVPLAVYPLLSDLLDATNTYGPVLLTGNPTPPSPPANGVCVNGIYFFNSAGQDIKTPFIGALNTNDFQFDVEFNIAAMPTATYASVLMGGNSYRWLGIYLQTNGTIGLKHNNSNLAWSTTVLSVGKWYIASVKYEAGTAELHIDGKLVLTVAVGPLNTGNNLTFTTNDYSNGRNHNGCIRNLVISNDTTLGRAASATNYGSACGGIALNANGVPSVGNATFALAVSNVPSISPLVYAALGQSVVNPGFDLTVLNMAGCFSYTSLDLGALGPGVAVGGVGTLPLPVPNDAGLIGLVLYAQGIAFSSATAFGLVTSNGTQLVLGL